MTFIWGKRKVMLFNTFVQKYRKAEEQYPEIFRARHCIKFAIVGYINSKCHIPGKR